MYFIIRVRVCEILFYFYFFSLYTDIIIIMIIEFYRYLDDIIAYPRVYTENNNKIRH